MKTYILGGIICPKCGWEMWTEKTKEMDTLKLIWLVRCVNQKCSEVGNYYRVRPSIELDPTEIK